MELAQDYYKTHNSELHILRKALVLDVDKFISSQVS